MEEKLETDIREISEFIYSNLTKEYRTSNFSLSYDFNPYKIEVRRLHSCEDDFSCYVDREYLVQQISVYRGLETIFKSRKSTGGISRAIWGVSGLKGWDWEVPEISMELYEELKSLQEKISKSVHKT